VSESTTRGSTGTHRTGHQQPRRRPRITRFRLAKGGVVHVTAWELAPQCRFVGQYALRAGRGANLLRLPKRIGKRRLRAGTYRFVGASRGAEVLNVRVRLVRRKQRLRVWRHHLVDVCSAMPLQPSALTAGGRRAAGGPPSHAPRQAGGGSIHWSRPQFLPPLLGDLNPANASPLALAVFFALVGGAIALLTAGALPERVAAVATGSAFLARHRAAITLGGFALLVAAALLLGFV
jgi:hypothetical protein